MMVSTPSSWAAAKICLLVVDGQHPDVGGRGGQAVRGEPGLQVVGELVKAKGSTWV